MLLIHHFAFSYEKIMKSVYERIKNEEGEIKISIF